MCLHIESERGGVSQWISSNSLFLTLFLCFSRFGDNERKTTSGGLDEPADGNSRSPDKGCGWSIFYGFPTSVSETRKSWERVRKGIQGDSQSLGTSTFFNIPTPRLPQLRLRTLVGPRSAEKSNQKFSFSSMMHISERGSRYMHFGGLPA